MRERKLMLILNVYCPELIQSLDYSSANMNIIWIKRLNAKAVACCPFRLFFSYLSLSSYLITFYSILEDWV